MCEVIVDSQVEVMKNQLNACISEKIKTQNEYEVSFEFWVGISKTSWIFFSIWDLLVFLDL